MVILGALGDDAGDAASGVLLQLCQRGLEVHIVAQLTDVVQQQLVTGLAGGRLAGHVVVLLHGEEVIGVVLGVLGRPCCLRAGSEIAGPAVLIFQNAAHEIVHCSRLIDPGLDNALVALAGSVAGDLAQQLGTVSGLLPCFLCGSRIDSAVPVTGILHVAVLLDDAEVQAVGGSIGGSEDTAVACTHDEDVGVHGLGDGSLVDVRLLALAAGCVVFFALSTSSYPPLRVGMLVAGMCLCLYYLMAAVNADYEGATLMLLPGAVTTGFRVWALMPGLDSVLFVESVPFYLLRCARLYDLPFAIGCMAFVCRRFALLFDRTEQLARELDARVAERTKELTAETEARKSMMLNIFHDLRSPLFAVSIRAASKDAWRITIRQ